MALFSFVRSAWAGRVLLAPLLLLASLGLTAAGPSPALAATICDTTYSETTVKTSLIVPDGAVCVVTGSTVRGDITVQPGGSLEVFESTVRGGIISTGAVYFFVCASEVRGSLVATGGTGREVEITDNIIRGNVVVSGNAPDQLWVDLQWNDIRGALTFEDNATDAIGIIGNTVGANGQVNRNYSPYVVSVLSNEFGGRLDCANNEVELDARDNVADAGVFGQCVEIPD